MRSSNRTSLAVFFSLLVALGATPALAGGPLILFDPASQTPYAYGPSVGVVTDLGTLGAVTNAQADVLTTNSAAEWSGVVTSSFSASVTGDFATRGLPDITGANANLVIGPDNTGNGIFVIYDTDGTVTQNFLGAPPGVLGVASPEFATGSTLTESWVVLNGATIDPGDLPNADSWAGVVTHEMGHSINLAHTQTNGGIIFIGDARGPSGCTPPYPTGGLALNDTETMYPFIDPSPGSTGVQQATIEHLDDTATLSDIYPAAGYPSDFGTIEGVIYDTDGLSELTGVNVIVRNVNDPFGDAQSALSGDFTQGALGADGRYEFTGLTPGESYVVYVDEILQGGFSTPPLQPLPGPEEFWNTGESNLTATDDPCDATAVSVGQNQTITMDIEFNGAGGPPVIQVTPASLSFTLAPNTLGSQNITIENIAGALDQDLEWSIAALETPGPGTLEARPSDPDAPMFQREAGLDPRDPAFQRQCRDCGDRHEVRATALDFGTAPQKAGTINDGGFELGPFGGAWNEFSSNFGTPICDTGTCGTGGGTGPRTGAYWCWFGGLSGATETGSVSQDVVIPSGSNCELRFYLEVPGCDSADDFMIVTVDGVEEYRVEGDSGLCGTIGYSLQTVDLSAYADGASHTIEFSSTTVSTNGGGTNFFIDDVSLVELLPNCTWLTTSPTSGTTPPGGSTVVSVQADATGLTPGVYDCQLDISSNDPVNPVVTVPVQLTVVAPNEVNAFVSTVANGPVSIPARPDGTGRPLTQALLWDGVVGNPAIEVDATIEIIITDGANNPIANYPAANIGVQAAAGGWTECPSLPLTADGPTDVNGATTISGVLAAGGSAAVGELMEIVIDDPDLNSITYAGGGAGLEIFVNSPDLSGDLTVDLVDVSQFAILRSSYAYAGDLIWDGVINLADISELSLGRGGECPVPPGAEQARPSLPSTDVMELTFDPTGSQSSMTLEPGVKTDAYLVLRGPAAKTGIGAWDARVRTSDNVVLHEQTAVAATLDLGRDGEHVVGFAQPRRATSDAGLVLLRLSLSVTDASPAYLYLEPTEGSLHDRPTIVSEGELSAARLTGGSTKVAAASLNDAGDTPSRRPLKLSLENTPNPFNPATEIRFQLPHQGRVELRIYDVRGQVVSVLRDEVLDAGEHTVTWRGTDRTGQAVASGVYYATLRTVDGDLTRKMLLVK